MEPKDYDKYLEKVSKIKKITEYDVPYFAGYNWQGTRIYLDKKIPKILIVKDKKLNIHMSLAMHEYVEKCHIDLGYTYAAAHEIAIKYERKYVEDNGVGWKDYDKAVGKIMHANWMSKWTSFPKDLDMTPYEYSRDLKTLAKIRKFLMK